MDRSELLDWLCETDEQRLRDLWRRADEVRRRHVGEQVHLRGLIEFSNHCVRSCLYCGLRAGHVSLRRYRMTADEIRRCADRAAALGYGTVVLQSGQDPALDTDWLAGVVAAIKRGTSLAVTLSVGEYGDEALAKWRDAGADRYLLRFETSNRGLYERIHPSLPGERSDRIAMLGRLRGLGYEVGSGVMIGIPGQTYEDLAADIELFGVMSLDMIGVGPYRPHVSTPLGQDQHPLHTSGDRQVPNSAEMACKVIALTRLVCPQSNVPSTTALAAADNADGYERGLLCGANVVMPNLTPACYRRLYDLYPGKACVGEAWHDGDTRIRQRIAAIGRHVGIGRGDSPSYLARAAALGRMGQEVLL